MREIHDRADAVIEGDPRALFAAITDIDRLPEWNRAIETVIERPDRLAVGANWTVGMHPHDVPTLGIAVRPRRCVCLARRTNLEPWPFGAARLTGGCAGHRLRFGVLATQTRLFNPRHRAGGSPYRQRAGIPEDPLIKDVVAAVASCQSPGPIDFLFHLRAIRFKRSQGSI